MATSGAEPPPDPTVLVPRTGAQEPRGDGFWPRLKRLLSGSRPAAAQPQSGPLARIFHEAVPTGDERLERAGQLGEGGMASVELLTDRAMRRKVAMKLLLPELGSEPQVVKSFICEAQVTAQLEHPNIVPVHDLGKTADDRLFFTMKRLEGRTLTDLVRALPEPTLDRDRLLDLLEIVLKVCDALAFAHQRGVVHRDVKPENVMVGDFGAVYLVDWGLAQLTGQEQSDGPEPVSSSFPGIWGTRVVGTPGYMSPEQANGGAVDERADVFAVGATLYFLLARRPPFDGASTEQALRRAQQCHYPPLEEAMRPGRPPRELARIITRAMARKPEDRQQSLAELRQDLVAFTRGGSLPTVRFEKGQVIIQEGNVGAHAYIITSGRCEVQKAVDGKQVRIRTIGPGECFGETAIMTSEPRTATVVALEDTTVERVTHAEFIDELDAMKPWVSVFLRSLAQRFQEREARGH